MFTKIRNTIHNLFRPRISADAAMEILGMDKMELASMHFMALVYSVPLTQIHTAAGLRFYTDEVTNLRDSAHPTMMAVRRNAQMRREEMVAKLAYNYLLINFGKEVADYFKNKSSNTNNGD